MNTFTNKDERLQWRLSNDILDILNRLDYHPYYDCQEFGGYAFYHIEDLEDENLKANPLAIDDNGIVICAFRPY